MSQVSGGDFLVNLGASLVLALLSFVAGWAVTNALSRQKLGYIRRIMPDRGGTIRIISPRIDVPEYESQTTARPTRLPVNNPLMPLQEGAAIARLSLAFRQVDSRVNVDVHLNAAPVNYDVLTVTVGGPAVNAATRSLVRSCFPSFAFPPEGVVIEFDGQVYDLSDVGAGEITEDYGFIAIARTGAESRTIALFGCFSHGTEMAAKTLLALHGNTAAIRAVRDADRAVIVVHGKVDGLRNFDVRIIAVANPPRDPALIE